MNSCLARRLNAFLIDVGIAYLLYFALGAPEPVGADPAPALLLLTWVIRVVPEKILARSPGKMLLRLDAVGPWWAPLVRHLWLIIPVPLAYLVPVIPWYSLLATVIGISALLHPANRSLADRLAQTTVIPRGAGCALPG
ncbi:MAG: RDD family protein [Corynebacterium pollutisoli]|uniref:RDD family protein n=1 Tax=Corynebacterium pollutisoli TaxID=1610489 RepID=A0A7X8RFJ6_9CORY|nr:RDD family protein [Corynebacterium pollutisoli]